MTLSVGLSLSLSVALGGCASSYQWVKDGFSTPHANAKFAACQLQAERLRFSTSEPDEDRADRILHEARLCMKADGWRWVQTDTLQSPEESGEEPGEAPRRSTSPSSADDSGSAEPTDQASSKSDDEKSDEKPGSKTTKTDEKDDDDDDDDDE